LRDRPVIVAMNALEISAVQKTYKNGVQALCGIDLSVEEGEFFALLGPNGAGKSTAIGIISSLVNKTAGSVRIFGHDLDHDQEAAKRLIGLVPQEFNFNMFEPVVDIVVNQAGYYGIGRRRAYGRAEKTLKQLGLWDKRRERARSLSGGMKRRLMIARALVHEPKLLILDEPTAGVDIEIRRSMWQFMRDANRAGTTIILTTHYLEEAESLCRTVAIINDGRIVEQGDVNTLLTSVQSETFVLNLDHAPHDGLELPGYHVHSLYGNVLEVEVDKDQGLNRLFNVLTGKGLRVLSMRNKANRLEEFFLKLVESQRVAEHEPRED
jgi:ABC-2 type transport system ATP-binding protein